MYKRQCLQDASQEKGFEDCGGDDQKDAAAEPARGGLARVGIARAELVVGFDGTHQSDYGADGVDQPYGRFEIALDHRLGLDQARRAVPLRIGSGRSQGYS